MELLDSLSKETSAHASADKEKVKGRKLIFNV